MPEDRRAVEPDVAAGNRGRAHDRVERRRLPGAVRPDQADQLAGGDGERHVREGLQAAEGDRDVVGHQHVPDVAPFRQVLLEDRQGPGVALLPGVFGPAGRVAQVDPLFPAPAAPATVDPGQDEPAHPGRPGQRPRQEADGPEHQRGDVQVLQGLGGDGEDHRHHRRPRPFHWVGQTPGGCLARRVSQGRS